MFEWFKHVKKLNSIINDYSNRRDETIWRSKCLPPPNIQSFAEYKKWLLEAFVSKDYKHYEDEDENISLKIENMGIDLINGKEEKKDSTVKGSSKKTSATNKTSKKVR